MVYPGKLVGYVYYSKSGKALTSSYTLTVGTPHLFSSNIDPQVLETRFGEKFFKVPIYINLPQAGISQN